jgi:hypothetical protein
MTHDSINLQIRELYTKLEKFHWSPKHPAEYVLLLPDAKKVVGIGLVAMNCPGAFNLVYALVKGALNTLADHQTAVNLYVTCERIARFEIKKQPLSSWLTLLSEEEFKVWISNVNCSGLPELQRIKILFSLPDIRGV